MAFAGQQFNLRWNNHLNNILEVFNEQLNAEHLVDVTLSSQGQFLKAHKMVLSACSPYFQELFNLHQVPHPVIIMNDVKFLDIKLVVEFMYRGEIKVQESNLKQLLHLAESLQVKGLANVRDKYEKGQIGGGSGTEAAKPGSGGEPANLARKSPQASRKSPPQSQSPSKRLTDPFKARCRRPRSTSEEDEDAGKDSSEEQSEPSSLIAAEVSSNGLSEQVSSGGGEAGSYDDDLPATIFYKDFAKVLEQDRNNWDKRISENLPEGNGPAGWEMIKVEPPDIRDIDEEGHLGWEAPKLVIDMDKRKQNLISRQIKSKALKALRLACISDRLARAQNSATTVEGTYMRANRNAGFEVEWPRRKTIKIPRPPNAFMIFANEWRKKLAYQFPMESNKEISVRLGVMWKNLTSDTKESYYTMSRKADEDHKLKYPGYYYSPKEARLRKEFKQGNRTGPAPKNSRPKMDAMHLVKVFMADDNNEPISRSVLITSSEPHMKRPKLEAGASGGSDNDENAKEIEQT